MSTNPNCIVTTVDSDGKSIFAEETPVDSSDAMGLTIHNIWGTADGIPKVGAGIDPQSVPFPFFPGPGGHRLIQVVFPPAAADSGGESDLEAEEQAVAEAEHNQPGIAGAFEPDNPGFHTTDSIDYGLCLDGELWLVLDDGQERHITPGTYVAQRGTRHAWQNRSSRSCTMLFVLLGAERA